MLKINEDITFCRREHSVLWVMVCRGLILPCWNVYRWKWAGRGSTVQSGHYKLWLILVYHWEIFYPLKISVTSVWIDHLYPICCLIVVVFIKISVSTSTLCCILCWDQALCLAANEEYYQLLMINDRQPSGLDVSSYTIEEIDSITSEYTLKNNVSHWVILNLSPAHTAVTAASGVMLLPDLFDQWRF